MHDRIININDWTSIIWPDSMWSSNTPLVCLNIRFKYYKVHLCPCRSPWQQQTWSSTVRSTGAATLCSLASLPPPILSKIRRPVCCCDSLSTDDQRQRIVIWTQHIWRCHHRFCPVKFVTHSFSSFFYIKWITYMSLKTYTTEKSP